MSCGSAGEDAFALTCHDLLPCGFSFIFVFTQKGEALLAACTCVQYFWDSLPPPQDFPVPEAGVPSVLVLSPPQMWGPLGCSHIPPKAEG